MTRARVDKDRSDYLSKTARPDSESQTAYWSNKSVEGDKDQASGNRGKAGDADRVGNKMYVYNGGTKKDTTRIADRPMKMVAGETGIGDTGTGLGESDNPFAKVLARKFGLQEDENPGVASSPSTSDNPSLGMAPINNTDFRQEKTNVKAVLESIALQAADAFELMDDNKEIPTAISAQLENCQGIINKFYNFMSNSQSNDSSDTSDTPPVQKDTAERKPAVNEETEGNPYIVLHAKKGRHETYANSTYEAAKKAAAHWKLKSTAGIDVYRADVKHSTASIGEETEDLDEDKVRAKKTMKEATDIVFRNLLKDKFDADY